MVGIIWLLAGRDKGIAVGSENSAFDIFLDDAFSPLNTFTSDFSYVYIYLMYLMYLFLIFFSHLRFPEKFGKLL